MMLKINYIFLAKLFLHYEYYVTHRLNLFVTPYKILTVWFVLHVSIVFIQIEIWYFFFDKTG